MLAINRKAITIDRVRAFTVVSQLKVENLHKIHHENQTKLIENFRLNRCLICRTLDGSRAVPMPSHSICCALPFTILRLKFHTINSKTAETIIKLFLFLFSMYREFLIAAPLHHHYRHHLSTPTE